LLINLSVRNVALIDALSVEFGPHLNVVSGETGAGKSIIMGALGFALGGKASRGFIRAGEDAAAVEALFSVTNPDARENLSALGVDGCDDGLLVFRSLSAAGKSVCRINGRVVSVALLKEAAAGLVDAHNQHESHSLLDPAKHIVLLDKLCDPGIDARKERLSALFDEYRSVSAQARGAEEEATRRERRRAELRETLAEVNAAKLYPDEETELAARRERASYAERLGELIGTAVGRLSGGDGDARDRAGKALACVTEAATLDNSLEPLRERFAAMCEELTDISEELSDYYDKIDLEPGALDAIEERLSIIRALKRKYGEDVLAAAASAETELSEFEREEIGAEDNAAKKKNLEREITAECAAISAERKRSAERIAREVETSLAELGMKGARFRIAVERRAGFTRGGFDRVEFFIAPNVGGELKPLATTASGGEMSRVMLALKSVLAAADSVETLVFDEIDTGISGKTAQMAAEMMARLSRGRQILCVTHLPQIAAMADDHFLIEKKSDGGAARTTLTALEGNSSVAEVARLISGAKITESSLAAASETRRMAEIFKNSL
jgi:DNA repair protein RecN (Recombination protein N)